MRLVDNVVGDAGSNSSGLFTLTSLIWRIRALDSAVDKKSSNGFIIVLYAIWSASEVQIPPRLLRHYSSSYRGVHSFLDTNPPHHTLLRWDYEKQNQDGFNHVKIEMETISMLWLMIELNFHSISNNCILHWFLTLLFHSTSIGMGVYR